MQTLGSVLDKKGGISYGFDFLRVFLASSIVFVHCFKVSLGQEYPHNLFYVSLLPTFFALSGFLITSSAMRLRLRDFILNRSFRIVPALMVDIVVSAWILGAVFTTVPLAQYYSSASFFAYFLNVFGVIHYYLLGVFESNPWPGVVNGSLWTIPYEIGCYALISIIIYTRLLHRRHLLLALLAALAVLVAAGFAAAPHLSEWLKPSPLSNLASDFSMHGRMLYVYFLTGSLFYLYRDKIPYSLTLFLAILAILLYRSYAVDVPTRQDRLMYVPFIVYIMAFIGISDIPRLPLFRRGDYSYGIYLYGSPVLQAITATLLPQRLSPFILFLIGYPLIVLVAMASWHWVEKPVLSLRKKFSFTARKGDELRH